MAKCNLGYMCEVCGLEVPEITDSDLYLRFVLGEVRAQELDEARPNATFAAIRSRLSSLSTLSFLL